MKDYLKNWNFMRVMRLALGIFIIVHGIIAKQWLIAGLDGLFSLMPLLNTGCCGLSESNTSIPRSNKKKKTRDISYEEVR